MLDREGPRVGIAIPSDIGAVMEADPALALAWRDAVRATFVAYLARGYEAVALRAGRPTSRYLLQWSGSGAG